MLRCSTIAFPTAWELFPLRMRHSVNYKKHMDNRPYAGEALYPPPTGFEIVRRLSFDVSCFDASWCRPFIYVGAIQTSHILSSVLYPVLLFIILLSVILFSLILLPLLHSRSTLLRCLPDKPALKEGNPIDMEERHLNELLHNDIRVSSKNDLPVLTAALHHKGARNHWRRLLWKLLLHIGRRPVFPHGEVAQHDKTQDVIGKHSCWQKK